ncbi:MAG TPA: GNAT family N-acetyltransferase [Puia sp.]|jgi:putative acetyltransferase
MDTCTDILGIRPIQPADNKDIASIIRNTFIEFGIDKPGTTFYDSSLDDMYGSFQLPGSCYYIGHINDRIAGGGGIFPSPGLPPGTCELVKMYLSSEARGKGLGRQIIERSLAFAGKSGYRHVYIETMPELRKAMSVYEKLGFYYLDGPMGNTGHYGCSIWMLKDL